MLELTKENGIAILSEISRRTRKQYLRGEVVQAEGLSIFDTKAGGYPYWPTSIPFPTNYRGEKLVLLAQINLEQVPRLSELPASGMLQFFIGADDSYGAFGDMEKHEYAVVYHATINRSVTLEDVLSLDIPTSLTKGIDFPVVGELGLRFELAEDCMGLCDCHFENLVKTVASDLGIALPDKMDALSLVEFVVPTEKEVNEWFNRSSGDKLGGYPYFTQEDPRVDDDDRVLLFQLDSNYKRSLKNYILWGDCGVGNFFIHPDDLAAKNFDNVFFSWDCC
ncbi:MAG: DUF1963 domain-containing protein [Lachnospiraceae bacterium]|nr:DUF1963 domain-containing protein [Lachnospiraceae bacterium]